MSELDEFKKVIGYKERSIPKALEAELVRLHGERNSVKYKVDEEQFIGVDEVYRRLSAIPDKRVRQQQLDKLAYGMLVSEGKVDECDKALRQAIKDLGS